MTITAKLNLETSLCVQKIKQALQGKLSHSYYMGRDF